VADGTHSAQARSCNRIFQVGRFLGQKFSGWAKTQHVLNEALHAWSSRNTCPAFCRVGPAGTSSLISAVITQDGLSAIVQFMGHAPTSCPLASHVFPRAPVADHCRVIHLYRQIARQRSILFSSSAFTRFNPRIAQPLHPTSRPPGAKRYHHLVPFLQAGKVRMRWTGTWP